MVNFLKNIYREIMKLKMKTVLNHLDNIGFIYELWIFKWYFSLFSNYFPKYYCIRFLDYIITDDLFSLVNLALAITKILEKNILKMNFIELVNLFKDNDQIL